MPIAEGQASTEHVVDFVGALSSDQEKELEEDIQRVVRRHDEDVVILFAELDGKTPTARADDYFDENGYGIGAKRSGILMLVAPGTRDVWFSTRGDSISTFTDAGIKGLLNTLKPSLSEGKWHEASTLFVSECERYMTAAEGGFPITSGPVAPFQIFVKWVFIIVASISGAFIAMRKFIEPIFVKKMSNEGLVPTARSYVAPNSFHVTREDVTLISSNVTSVPKPPPSSLGDSSIHISSSGAEHGGGGGKF